MTFYLSRSSLVVLAIALVACGASGGPGRGFDLHFADNRPADVSAVASAAASHAIHRGDPLVAIVPSPPARGLTVFALPDGQRLWETAVRIDARPTIAGPVVVSHADGQVVAWDARTGHEQWRTLDHGFSIVGADGDADTVAVSLGPGGLSQRHGVFLVLDARTGARRIEQSVEQALGTPTIAAGYAFVPWNGQYLSIFDAHDGQERARIRSTDDVFGRALHEGGAVYFGSRALYRLAPESATGHREGALTYTLPREDLPGNPPLLADGYAPAYAGVNARERVAVSFRPDPSRSGAHFVDDTVYVVFHRVVFSIDAAHPGTVHWAYVHGADIAGYEPVRGGFVFVDERGAAVMLDGRHGNVVYQRHLASPAAQAVLRLPIDFAPPHANEEPAQSPTTTLLAVAASTDNRLVPARLFAVRSLATVPGDEATRGLLDIASRLNYPQDLRAAAGEALSHRTEGTDAMLAALHSHYDYVRQTLAPPVGFIARALANAHDRRALPGLIAQLQDPETPASELPPLVAALRDFGDASAVPALLDFVRLYHADQGLVPPVNGGDPVSDRTATDQEAIASALEIAIQTIAQLGGPPERRWLEALADDDNAIQSVHEALEHALTHPVASNASGAPSGHGDTTASEDTQPAAPIDDPNFPPPHLTSEMIARGFADLRESMMHCLDGLASRPSQIRLQFRYDGEGNISSVTVTPPTLQGCIVPIASRAHFHRSQVAREIATWYLIGGPQ